MNGDIKKYYEDYGKKVYLYLMSLCGNEDTAEELTQETFYQAIKSLPKYKGNSSVYTWLCGIAKNMWYRELERRRRTPIAEQDESVPEEVDPARPPDQMAELRETKLNVMKRIHKLPETEKEIVLLRASGELTFAEIGEILGITETKARVVFYRAKQKLKGE